MVGGTWLAVPRPWACGSTLGINLEQSFIQIAANGSSEPISLKNYSLIVAQAADSICLLDRGICGVGTKAGGAGSRLCCINGLMGFTV